MSNKGKLTAGVIGRAKKAIGLVVALCIMCSLCLVTETTVSAKMDEYIAAIGTKNSYNGFKKVKVTISGNKLKIKGTVDSELTKPTNNPTLNLTSKTKYTYIFEDKVRKVSKSKAKSIINKYAKTKKGALVVMDFVGKNVKTVEISPH